MSMPCSMHSPTPPLYSQGPITGPQLPFCYNKIDHVNGQVIKDTTLNTDSDVAKFQTAISNTPQAFVKYRQKNS
jgi:hypothetical protein